MGEVTYAPLGPWWTLDGPSLRLPGREGRYVSVWMAGHGPLVALVPRRGVGIDCWLPLMSALTQQVTVLAIEPSSAEPSNVLDVDDIVTVVNGTGAELLLSDGDGGDVVLAGLDRADLQLPVVMHAWAPAPEPEHAVPAGVRLVGSRESLLADNVGAITALVLESLRDQRRASELLVERGAEADD